MVKSMKSAKSWTMKTLMKNRLKNKMFSAMKGLKKKTLMKSFFSCKKMNVFLHRKKIQKWS